MENFGIQETFDGGQARQNTDPLQEGGNKRKSQGGPQIDLS